MLNETFYIDGIDARSFGIYLQKPIKFSEAVPVVKKQTIPGRNGDLIFETGSYQNRTAVASCFCLQKDVEKTISAAGRFLMAKHGYRRLETSDDPDHFWLARVENSPQIAQRVRTLAPFDISFDCKPQRFLKSGEEKMIFPHTQKHEEIQIYNNFGFPARPLIYAKWSEVTEHNYVDIIFYDASGNSMLDKNIRTFDMTVTDLYIDCDTHNAYNNDGNQNHNVVAYNFPALDIGLNNITIIGPESLESVEIMPRWWEL